jgi:hypothetical protein
VENLKKVVGSAGGIGIEKKTEWDEGGKFWREK